jgi:hypothetical protein
MNWLKKHSTFVIIAAVLTIILVWWNPGGKVTCLIKRLAVIALGIILIVLAFFILAAGGGEAALLAILLVVWGGSLENNALQFLPGLDWIGNLSGHFASASPAPADFGATYQWGTPAGTDNAAGGSTTAGQDDQNPADSATNADNGG